MMLIVFLIAGLIGAGLGVAWPAGLGYAAGSLLAVSYARRESLILVVVAPPLLFAVAVTVAELILAPGGGLGTAEGTLLILAGVLPWLLGGWLAGLVVALVRGLPGCLRDLNAAIAGQGGPANLETPAPARPARGRSAAGNSAAGNSAAGDRAAGDSAAGNSAPGSTNPANTVRGDTAPEGSGRTSHGSRDTGRASTASGSTWTSVSELRGRGDYPSLPEG